MQSKLVVLDPVLRREAGQCSVRVSEGLLAAEPLLCAEGDAARAQVMGPKPLAGTAHTENPGVSSSTKGTYRQISS